MLLKVRMPACESVKTSHFASFVKYGVCYERPVQVKVPGFIPHIADGFYCQCEGCSKSLSWTLERQREAEDSNPSVSSLRTKADVLMILSIPCWMIQTDFHSTLRIPRVPNGLCLSVPAQESRKTLVPFPWIIITPMVPFCSENSHVPL